MTVIDLVIGEGGAVFLAADGKLDRVPDHIRFHADQRLLVLCHDDGEEELLNREIPADLAPALRAASHLIMVEIGAEAPTDGWRISLETVG